MSSELLFIYLGTFPMETQVAFTWLFPSGQKGGTRELCEEGLTPVVWCLKWNTFQAYSFNSILKKFQ